MITVEFIFIGALFLSVYSYVIFPAMLMGMCKLFPAPWTEGQTFPMVTLIISAYNEEKNIQEKVRNALLLDYPEDRLEIIVSSDGSNDRTNEIVAGITDRRLVLKAFKGRHGKTDCLNRVIPHAKGEIVLFTDANAMFPPEMLGNLVKNFYDTAVGAVTGWTHYFHPDSGEETTGFYAKFEKIIKCKESLISSCVGADGAIFAIRKELYIPLGANDINDFIIPLNIIRQGKRVVLDASVFCTEEATEGAKNIFNRQVRITTRTAWALRRHIDLINGFKYGSFSFFLVSHKVLRLLTPFFLLTALVLNLFVLKISFFYVVSLAGLLICLFTGMAALAGVGMGKGGSICKYLLITFAAQFIGCWRMLMGIEDILWTPKR